MKGDGASGAVDRVALEEVPVAGMVAGSCLNTRAADGVSESIQETESAGPIPTTRVHYLEHKWIVDVKAGSTVTLFLRAHHRPSPLGNDFVFAYSTDDSTYQDLLTVTATEDLGSYQTASLPPSLSGRVYLRARNTNLDPQNLALSLNALYLDHLFIRSQ